MFRISDIFSPLKQLVFPLLSVFLLLTILFQPFVDAGFKFDPQVTQPSHSLDFARIECVSSYEEDKTREDHSHLLNYDDVVLIVNDNSQMSRDVADYFVANRNFPVNNIINITAPTGETVNRNQFNDFREQIEENITDRNLTLKINYIITTKGVPLRISGGANQRASVDSELALILNSNQNYIGNNGWMINPYYGQFKPFTSKKYDMYLVTRLTAYTFDEIKAIIDNAANSLNVTGEFVLDVDPGRDGSPGYKIGNDWLRSANHTLSNMGMDTYFDTTNTFVNNRTGVMGYSSWGSNDGHWFKNLVSNSNMETDGNGDDIPDSWYPVEQANSSVNRSDEDSYRNTYSVKLARQNSGDGEVSLYQDFYVEPDRRYYLSGYANLSGVSSDGYARLRIKAVDSHGDVLWNKYGTQRRGTTNEWKSMGQLIYEPIPGVVRLELGCTLFKSSGTAYFDYVRLNEIRPHMEFLPGAIAETFVSTGGRSMTYGTAYGQSLVADLLREGVTGVKGYTWEPYLSAISHPDKLLPWYASGYDLASSFWAGSQFIGWMGTVIGDPKCAPYYYSRPDLEVTSLELSHAEPSQHEDLQINITLTNSGFGDADSTFSITLWNDSIGGEDLDTRFHSLSAGGNLALTFKIEATQMNGTNRFVLEVDRGNNILETDESNNIELIELYVNERPKAVSQFPHVEVLEDSFNNSLDLTDMYFSDREGDLLHFRVEPHGISDYILNRLNYSIEEGYLNISVYDNMTIQDIVFRIYCDDRYPVGNDIFLDLYVSVLPINDPPFLWKTPLPIVLNEGGIIESQQLKERDIFRDIDSDDLYYAIRIMEMEEISGISPEEVNITLKVNDDIKVISPGDYYGNITLRTFCWDERFNLSALSMNDTGPYTWIDLVINIQPINDAPKFEEEDVYVFIPEDAYKYPTLNLSSVCHDIDNDFDSLKWDISDIVPQGKAEANIEDGRLLVTLPLNYTDGVLMKLRVSDGQYTSDCYVHLEPVPLNDLPVLNIKSLSEKADGNLSLKLEFTDSDTAATDMRFNISVDRESNLNVPLLEFIPVSENSYRTSMTLVIDHLTLTPGNHTLWVEIWDSEDTWSEAMALFLVPEPQGGENGDDDDDNNVSDDDNDDTGGSDDNSGINEESEKPFYSEPVNLIVAGIVVILIIGSIALALALRRKKSKKEVKGGPSGEGSMDDIYGAYLDEMAFGEDEEIEDEGYDDDRIIHESLGHSGIKVKEDDLDMYPPDDEDDLILESQVETEGIMVASEHSSDASSPDEEVGMEDVEDEKSSKIPPPPK